MLSSLIGGLCVIMTLHCALWGKAKGAIMNQE